MQKLLPILLMAVFLVLLNCNKNKIDMQKLKTNIEGIISASEGTIAVAFEDLISGKKLFINEKIQMHAASTMKVPVMIEIFKQADEGKINLADSLLIKNKFTSIADGSSYSMNITEDSDDVVYKNINKKMSIYDLVYQMITVSSNFATNILIDVVQPKNIKKTMDSIGANVIKVLRGVEDLKAYQQGLNNTTDAYDLLLIMKAIANKNIVTPRACDEMIKILLEQKFNNKIPALLPSNVKVAHKTGSITNIDHDAAIVYHKNNQSYVLVTLTKGIADHTKAAELIAQISKIIYDAVSVSE